MRKFLLKESLKINMEELLVNYLKTELIFKNLSLKKDMGKYIRNTPINVNGVRNNKENKWIKTLGK